MACRTTSTSGRRAGFTLVEMLFAVAVGTLALAVVCSLMRYGALSFVAMANYVDLNQQSQQTLDRMTRAIRQTDLLISFTTNRIAFTNGDGSSLQFVYDKSAGKLRQVSGGQTNTLLTGCDSLTFSMYQRTPISNSFLPYSTGSTTNAKVIELDWHCYRTILSAQANTESIQSAKVVIRNH